MCVPANPRSEKFEKVRWANQGESCGERWERQEIIILKIGPWQYFGGPCHDLCGSQRDLLRVTNISKGVLEFRLKL